MKKLLAILLVLTMVLGLCACGGAKVDEALLGTYTCYAAETEGIELPADMIFTEPCTVVLNANGKADFNLDGDKFTVDYTIDGNTIEMKDGSDTITGTIGDGQMEIDLMGVILYMSKDGAAPAAAAEEAAEETAEEAPAAVGFEPVTAEAGDYTLSIVGAETFDDADGEPAIRFYYDFTNNTDDVVCAVIELDWYAAQDGYELMDTYAAYEDDVPEYEHEDLYILPGMTIRCISEYTFKPDGGEIVYTVSDWYTEEGVTATFTPDTLPGRPADLEMPTITDCTWAADLPTSGDFDSGLYSCVINDYEIVDSYDGGKVVRVNVDFTNNSDEETTLWAESVCYAIQDGVEIESSYAAEEIETDDNDTEYVQPGQTITCSLVYELRSGSPVELIVEDYAEDCRLGLVIPVE